MGDTTNAGSMRKVAYWSLAVLVAMNLLNYIDRYVLAAVMEKVQVDPETACNDFMAGWLFTAFLISYSLFSPVMGWLGDRRARKRLLALGVGVWSLATFWSGLAHSYTELLLARSLLGIGEATYATIAPTLIADLFPRAQRNRALSVFYVAIPVGTALGFGIGGQVTEYFDNWRYAFYVVGLPGLAIAFAALLIHEPPRGISEGPDEGAEFRRETLPASWSIYATLCRNRSFVFTTLGMAMMTFAIGGLANWVPKFISLERGLGLKKASLYMGAVICIAGLVGTALGGIIADPLTRRIRGAYFWLSGLTMLASVPLIWLALVAHPTWLIFGSMALGLIFVFVGTGPSNAIVVNVTPPNIRAAAFAVNIFALHILGDIPSPPLMGLISDATNNMYYGLLIAIPALVLSALFFCFGAPFLEADQKAIIQRLRTGNG